MLGLYMVIFLCRRHIGMPRLNIFLALVSMVVEIMFGI